MPGSDWIGRNATIITPRQGLRIVEERLEDEAVLIDPHSGRAHHLNATAASVWHSCDGRTTTRQIAEGMSQVYEVGFEDALDYVDELMALFAESHLLESEAEA
jgi:hypothetical protein